MRQLTAVQRVGFGRCSDFASACVWTTGRLQMLIIHVSLSRCLSGRYQFTRVQRDCRHASLQQSSTSGTNKKSIRFRNYNLRSSSCGLPHCKDRSFANHAEYYAWRKPHSTTGTDGQPPSLRRSAYIRDLRHLTWRRRTNHKIEALSRFLSPTRQLRRRDGTYP
jgi:hypothetical protein